MFRCCWLVVSVVGWLLVGCWLAVGCWLSLTLLSLSSQTWQASAEGPSQHIARDRRENIHCVQGAQHIFTRLGSQCRSSFMHKLVASMLCDAIGALKIGRYLRPRLPTSQRSQATVPLSKQGRKRESVHTSQRSLVRAALLALPTLLEKAAFCFAQFLAAALHVSN